MTEDACDTLFVFQAFDADTETVSAEWRVRIGDMDQLKSILAPESDGDPDLARRYSDLSANDMLQIGKLCLPPIVPDPIFTGLCRPSEAFDKVPYLIHTNLELPLMLEGRKPLAVFEDGYPSDWLEELLAPFNRFVASGQILRRIIEVPMPHLKQHRPDLEGMRTVFFALPGEEWRVDAYIDQIIHRTRDWDDDLERLQGSLLGYEDWQNDWWLEQRVKSRSTQS
ncbi:hypothetical protein [Oryzibacter oryziterrae]|uniref:hypothetical protein n=1 Tax=Oryzibacter oryziterrae TaxID=2766474 RepID=UPI001F1DEAC7|nr:hypothetical protein [Oryzibacter oryziterrae]